MFGEVLNIPAGGGGSGQPLTEHGLPNGTNEAPFLLPLRLALYQLPNHRGWLALWLWLPIAGESWCYPPPWEPGRHPPPTHTHANLRMSSIYTWLWECVTHGASVPHSWSVHFRVQHLIKGEGKVCPALSLASEAHSQG